MEILIPVLIAAAVSIVVGAGLSIAATFFNVPKNEKEAAVREALPGANCGACGFSGCDDYAAALANGNTEKCSLCAPGGQNTAAEIANIMGLEAGEVTARVAKVYCIGYNCNTHDKMNYKGAISCKAAKQLHGGKGSCIYGCIGFGDCAAVCPSDAISICDGVAVINPEQCTACTLCVTACPNGLISIIPADKSIRTVLCSNHDKGAQTKKVCETGCIACMKCVKVCKFNAIKVENFLASIDPEKCTGCGKCNDVCPQQVIH